MNSPAEQKEHEAKAALRAWIINKSTHAEAKSITDDTQILEKRILNSIQVMDLILAVEQLSGRPVDPDFLKPGVFSSVNQIYKTFWLGVAP